MGMSGNPWLGAFSVIPVLDDEVVSGGRQAAHAYVLANSKFRPSMRSKSVMICWYSGSICRLDISILMNEFGVTPNQDLQHARIPIGARWNEVLQCTSTE